MPATNGHTTLSAAESERLAMLMEECGEVIQAAAKVLRHGYEEHHPNTPAVTNRSDLARELADLLAVAGWMGDADGIQVDDAAIRQAAARKRRYAHHQPVEV